MGFDLPRTLTLPSGTRVTLRRRSSGSLSPARPREGARLFEEVLALFEEDVAIVRGKTELDVQDLPLGDFHVVRAFLTKAGLVHEDEVEIDCRNCGEVLLAHPCRALETGPWEDGELGDPELDVTAELGVPLEIAPIPLGRVRHASTITLAPRTVREVMLEVTSGPAIEREALNVAEVAEACGRSVGWVYDAIKHHGMPAKRPGGVGKLLVPLPALREWLNTPAGSDLAAGV